MSIITRLIHKANKQKASDLHLVPGNYPALRIDNKIFFLEDEPLIDIGQIDELIDFFLNDKQKKSLSEEKIIGIGYNFDNGLRATVHVSYQKSLPSIYLRFVPQKIKSISELGLPDIVSNFIEWRRGLIIISGPFNSGKSSTVAALINALSNSAKSYIVTLEGPIEYIFEGKNSIIEQKEIGIDVVDYESGLADLQQRDLDVLFIDKFEENEVIRRVLEIAEGNALVITTLNSESSIAVLEKVIFSFPLNERSGVQKTLAESLKAIVVQRLIPKIGGGQILAYEIMIVNRAIKLLIGDGNLIQIDNILQTSRDEGMIGLDKKLAELVRGGEIAREEALKRSLNPQAFNGFL